MQSHLSPPYDPDILQVLASPSSQIAYDGFYWLPRHRGTLLLSKLYVKRFRQYVSIPVIDGSISAAAPKKNKGSQKGAIYGSAMRRLNNGTRQDNPTMLEQQWQKFFQGPYMSENRSNKVSNAAPCQPHHVTWANCASVPTENRKKTLTADHPIMDHRWQKFFGDPSVQWDNRRYKDINNDCFRAFQSNSTGWDFGEIEGIDSEPKSIQEKLKIESNPESMHVKLNSLQYMNAAPCWAHHKRGINYMMASEIELQLIEKNTLMDMFVKCGRMVDAHNVFATMQKRDVVSWNIMILGYAKQQEGMQALELYAHMQQEGVQPSDRTFVAVLKACSSLAEMEEGDDIDDKFVKSKWLGKGRAIHSQVVMSGSELNVFVENTLIDMYVKCRSTEDARRVFDEMPHRTAVSWNAMILGHAEENGALALELYARMHQEGILPEGRTFVSTLKACSNLAALELGKQVDGKLLKLGCLEQGRAIHCQAVKSCVVTDVFVGTNLVDIYVKCGSMEDARHVFDKMPYRNVVSWTAMISGYCEQEECREALRLHAQMQEQGLSADSVAFVSILGACGNTAVLEAGKELHAQICIFGLEATAIVANALVDMYSKCGSMADAQQLFDTLPTRDLVTWNALIAGYARQGDSKLVFSVLERLKKEGIHADGITFLSVLTVCSHAGLVDEGQRYLQAMSKEYGITPTIEHYNCMIDLLGRIGRLEEALAMVKLIPCQPDAVSWTAVLAACRIWKNLEVGGHAFECVLTFDEKRAAPYVLMSNVCADDYMRGLL